MNSSCLSATLLAAVFIAAAVGRATANDAADADTVSTCLACHQGQRSFKGRDCEQLAAGIRAILDGKLRHPPLDLDDSGEAAVIELARTLTTE